MQGHFITRIIKHEFIDSSIQKEFYHYLNLDMPYQVKRKLNGYKEEQHNMFLMCMLICTFCARSYILGVLMFFIFILCMRQKGLLSL